MYVRKIQERSDPVWHGSGPMFFIHWHFLHDLPQRRFVHRVLLLFRLSVSAYLGTVVRIAPDTTKAMKLKLQYSLRDTIRSNAN